MINVRQVDLSAGFDQSVKIIEFIESGKQYSMQFVFNFCRFETVIL